MAEQLIEQFLHIVSGLGSDLDCTIGSLVCAERFTLIYQQERSACHSKDPSWDDHLDAVKDLCMLVSGTLPCAAKAYQTAFTLQCVAAGALILILCSRESLT